MIYEFQCPKCKNTQEIKESMKIIQTIKPICKKCGMPLQRVYGTPRVQFVGSGFYVNDYKGK
jgi:putative FmdB family regulatory protein